MSLLRSAGFFLSPRPGVIVPYVIPQSHPDEKKIPLFPARPALVFYIVGPDVLWYKQGFNNTSQ